MNYVFNKNSRFFRRPNDRYLIKLDKSEAQKNINNKNNNNNIQSTNIYNSNYFALNRIINTKGSLQMQNYNNYNYLKKESSKKYPSVRPSHSIENNLKYYNVTNFKNIPQKASFSYKKPINYLNDKEKEDNKISDNNNNDGIPTIVKIQKLIECLQNKNPKNTNNLIIENLENKEKKEIKEIKEIKDIRDIRDIRERENNILPNLINMQKPSFDEFNPQINKRQKAPINNINLFCQKDLISRVNNTKIKLKEISNNKLHKNINKNKNDKENNNNIIIVDIKKKNKVPKIRLPKISLDRVKNIIKKNLIVDNNGNREKVVNIRLKLNPQQTRNYFNMNNKINNNTIFMDTKKESVKFCISNYNNFKSDLMGLKKTFHHLENQRTKKDSLVNKNQTMHKNPLNDQKFKKENPEDDDYDDENINDPRRYSKYFLPSSGFGLLTRHNN